MQGHKLSFAEAIKLEVERFYVNLSAAERDKALLSVGVDPATLDPNRLLSKSYTAELYKFANRLALLGQTAFEDKIIASIGLESVKNDAIDFWNVNGLLETCSGGMCAVRAERKTTSQLPSASLGEKSLLLTCCHCERKACKVCCAGRGAILLSNYISKEIRNTSSLSEQSGSRHGRQSEGSLISGDGVICKSCCEDVILDAIYVDYIRVLSSLRRRARSDIAAKNALDEVIGLKQGSAYDFQKGIQIGTKQLSNLLNQEESLAEFPYASLLHSVIFTNLQHMFLIFLSRFFFGQHD